MLAESFCSNITITIALTTFSSTTTDSKTPFFRGLVLSTRRGAFGRDFVSSLPPLRYPDIPRHSTRLYFSRNSKESLFLSFRALTKKTEKKKKTEINNLLEHFVLPHADACRRMKELARATSSTSNKVFVLTSPTFTREQTQPLFLSICKLVRSCQKKQIARIWRKAPSLSFSFPVFHAHCSIMKRN